MNKLVKFKNYGRLRYGKMDGYKVYTCICNDR